MDENIYLLLVITVLVDALAPLSARASAGIVMNKFVPCIYTWDLHFEGCNTLQLSWDTIGLCNINVCSCQNKKNGVLCFIFCDIHIYIYVYMS